MSCSLSTQENFWLLAVFQAMMKATAAPRLSALKPNPEAVSANASSASWRNRNLAKLEPFSVNGLRPGGSFVLKAEYQSTEKETAPVTRGIRMDRVVKNLTAPDRDGSSEAPFRLGIKF